MKRSYIHSSVLRSAGYDKENKILEIHFINGPVYRYYNVPETVFYELFSANSAGEYFNKNISNGKYAYEQVE